MHTASLLTELLERGGKEFDYFLNSNEHAGVSRGGGEEIVCFTRIMITSKRSFVPAWNWGGRTRGNLSSLIALPQENGYLPTVINSSCHYDSYVQITNIKSLP